MDFSTKFKLKFRKPRSSKKIINFVKASKVSVRNWVWSEGGREWGEGQQRECVGEVKHVMSRSDTVLRAKTSDQNVS